MMKKRFNRTGQYTWFVLKREGLFIIGSTILLTLFVLAQANAFVDLYPDAAGREVLARSMKNPAVIAIKGAIYGEDNYTFGAMLANQTLLITMAITAIINVFFVNRNTRGDEEKGRAELIQSLSIGRLSNLSAVMITTFILNALYAVSISAGLYLLDISTVDLEGILLYGLIIFATGWLFAAITAVFANMYTTSQEVLTASFLILGGSYLLRAVGDNGHDTLSSISPLGWLTQSQVFVENNWHHVIIILILSLPIICAAFYAASQRELGEGYMPAIFTNSGNAINGQEYAGLLWRLQRNNLLIWLVVFITLGWAYGSLLGELTTFFDSSEMIKDMVNYSANESAINQFIAFIMPMMALLNTVPAIMTIFKLRSEETNGRLELIVSRRISRSKIILSAIEVSIIQSIVLQGAFTLTFWLSGNQVVDQTLELVDIAKDAFIYLPAIWLMVALAVCLLGWLPRLCQTIWAYFGYNFVVMFLGSTLQLSDKVKNASPYEWIPQLAIEDISYKGISTIIALTLALFFIGIQGYKKRDLLA